MKKCSKCKVEKSKDQFHKNSIAKDGLRTECKVCHNKHYKKNKNRMDRLSKAYKAKYSEKINAQRKLKQKLLKLKYQMEKEERLEALKKSLGVYNG